MCSLSDIKDLTYPLTPKTAESKAVKYDGSYFDSYIAIYLNANHKGLKVLVDLNRRSHRSIDTS